MGAPAPKKLMHGQHTHLLLKSRKGEVKQREVGVAENTTRRAAGRRFVVTVPLP
jgi:hypothetical protein